MPKPTLTEPRRMLNGWRRLVLATIIALAIAIALSKANIAFAGTRLDMAPSVPQQLYQGWVDTARVPTADATVIVHLRNCDENAMTCMVWHKDGPQIYYPDMSYMWTETGRDPADQVKMQSLFLHELGHVWDYYASRRSNIRAKFMRLMGLRGGWWSWRYEDVAPGESFADAYSYCAQGVYPEQSAYEGYRSYRPSPKLHQRVCALIQATG